MNYDGENNIISQNQKRGLLRTSAGKTAERAAQFLSISFSCCSAKFQTCKSKRERWECALSQQQEWVSGIKIMKDECLQFPTPGCRWFYQRTCQMIHLEFFKTLRAQHLQFNERSAGNSTTILKPYGCLKSPACLCDVFVPEPRFTLC